MEILDKEKKDQELQKKASIDVPLLPEDETDVLASKRIHFASNDPTVMRKSKRKDIWNKPLFGGQRNKLQTAKLKMDSRLFRNSKPSSSGSGQLLSSLRTQLGVAKKKS